MVAAFAADTAVLRIACAPIFMQFPLPVGFAYRKVIRLPNMLTRWMGRRQDRSVPRALSLFSDIEIN
jgi:hypothetical protein